MLSRLKEFLLLLPLSTLKSVALVVLLLFLLYLPVGILWIHAIDDDLTLATSIEHEAGTSQAVSVAVRLLDREINSHHWTPSDPFFMPGAWLDRMPAFQRGILNALSRFAIEMSDQIGRRRGSSEIDPDLQKAVGLLNYPPHVWLINPSVSYFIPTASSEKQYRAAITAFQSYNSRLISGDATFERRADNLQATLDRIASDIGSSSAALATRIHDRGLVDLEADVEFYNIKGKIYAYAMLLDALHGDFATVIREKQLESNWEQMQESMYIAASLSNFWIFNNAPDNQLLPNHLTAIGFYLLRARTQMKEVSNILLK